MYLSGSGFVSRLSSFKILSLGSPGISRVRPGGIFWLAVSCWSANLAISYSDKSFLEGCLALSPSMSGFGTVETFPRAFITAFVPVLRPLGSFFSASLLLLFFFGPRFVSLGFVIVWADVVNQLRWLLIVAIGVHDFGPYNSLFEQLVGDHRSFLCFYFPYQLHLLCLR